MSSDDARLLGAVATLVARVGIGLRDAPRRAGFALKTDGSPVTAADVACQAALAAGLEDLLPGVAVVGEEDAPADGLMPADDLVWLVDPLDGTRAFADGRDDYCVCVALVERGAPRLGVIGAPAAGLVYAGGAGFAWRAAAASDGALGPDCAPLASRRPAARPPVGLASDRHGDPRSDALLDRLGVAERVRLSSALKFARLASGESDLYVRLAPTMGWDTAAGQAILEAAGGVALDGAGRPLSYSPGAPLRNPGFIASGDPALGRAAAAALAG
jgi:3'(2'), 5'-bisphosphate nucleotidase